MQKHILIVEDEPAIRDMVAFALRKAGMEPAHAADARGAQSMIAERVPDLILLDWMLPGMSGLDLARRLRKEDLTRDVPIIMLTARGEETDRVGGLEAGVDDYVVKPFSPRELIARINAVMRRTHGVDGDGVVSVGALRIDSGAHRVYARQEAKQRDGAGEAIEVAVGEAIVPIGPTEYRLLHFFMTHAERVYSRSQLLDYVWGGSVYVEERTVDVHIRRLRQTLEPFGCQDLVQTVRGAGYRFSTTPAE
ncbi:MAG TPA: phosphate regulon transcriptional regulator PhoB [Rhodanobacteraceae bacterium]|nr:phosphate regulon transcriptional regulator PhoB [Rhodanobacteraceae bacterium]